MSVQYERDGTIGYIWLRRPEVHHALNRQMVEDLGIAIEQCAHTPNLRVVILAAEGSSSFCAGADLTERSRMSVEDVRRFVRELSFTFTHLSKLRVPVIAAMTGNAFGGGLELAMAADIRILAERASVGLTETSWAIIPGAGGTQRLPQLVGVGKAKELIYTACRISAREAWRIGLVQQIAPQEEVLKQAETMAAVIAANGPVAIQQAKKALDMGSHLTLEERLQLEQEAYERVIGTQDRLEGLRAFQEKRKPIYRGE
ncbi:enoyl-CoA hydratase-related protein [Rubeoparvulum massiliense]|uniref:enoyl-CoA hydratase-related protein n=1 Tax=Rubeoparvulum massiliense TaxID=1631346 RepID=UPI00065E4F99|nr:enoyl-CoA hydratase-related protein [Rubeoparvulum massiliense]